MSEKSRAGDLPPGIVSDAGEAILFDTLIASRPGGVTARAASAGVSAVLLHVALGGTLIWATTGHVSLRDQSTLDEIPAEVYVTWGIGSVPDPGRGLTDQSQVTPTPEEIAAQLEEAELAEAELAEAPLMAGGAGSEVRERIDEMLGIRLPGGAFPAPRTADAAPTTTERDVMPRLGLAPMNLDRLTAVSPELALSSWFLGWPLIRNPTVVTRFIMGSYAELRRDPRDKVFVNVGVWINEAGRVEWAEVLESSGEAALDRIALATFEDVVVFAPARREGAAAPLSIVITVSFPF